MVRWIVPKHIKLLRSESIQLPDGVHIPLLGANRDTVLRENIFRALAINYPGNEPGPTLFNCVNFVALFDVYLRDIIDCADNRRSVAILGKLLVSSGRSGKASNTKLTFRL